MGWVNIFFASTDASIKQLNRSISFKICTSWIDFVRACKNSNRFRIHLKNGSRSRSRSDLRLSRFWFLNLLKRQRCRVCGLHHAASRHEPEHARPPKFSVKSDADMSEFQK